MPKVVLPFDTTTLCENPKVTMHRLGIGRPRLMWLIENGHLAVMAVAPGVRRCIVTASVDAYLERINSTATVPALS